MKVKRLISRSINKIYETVIIAIGVDEIIHPEEESAERMAKRLQMKEANRPIELHKTCKIWRLSHAPVANSCGRSCGYASLHFDFSQR